MTLNLKFQLEHYCFVLELNFQPVLDLKTSLSSGGGAHLAHKGYIFIRRKNTILKALDFVAKRDYQSK